MSERAPRPLRLRATAGTILLAAFAVVSTGMASAQEAAPVTTELPAIEITAPSPIVKPKSKARPGTGPAQAAPATPSDDAALPGTVVETGPAVFVPLTVATEREIQATGGATLTDTLETKPGITGTGFAAGANRPIIRGLDSYRVLTQENGIGTHDVAAISEDHAIPVDPNAADRIEVVRGPATLRYGSQAIGGVVAVENERIPTAIPAGGIAATVRGGLTSVDEGADGAFKVTAGSRATGFAVHADGFARSAEDYDTPRGREQNSFVDSKGGSVGLSRVWSDGFVGVAFAHIDSLYGVPGEEAREGVAPRIDMEQQKVLARGEWRVRDFGLEAVRFWFGASDYAHDELARHADGHDDDHDHDHGDDHDHDEAVPFSLGSRFTNKEQEARIELQHLPLGTVLGTLNGAVGVQLGHRKTRGQSFEGESLLEPASTDTVAAFWFQELDVTSRFSLQAAARIERTRVDGTGWEEVHGLGGDHGHGHDDGDDHDDEEEVHIHAHTFSGERTFTPTSASLGALYRLPFDTVARVSGQYVERAPDAAELFSKGMHEATGTFEVGNPFLDVEKAATAEIGLKKERGALRFDASAYYTRYTGFIYRELQGVACNPVAENGEFHCTPSHHDHDHDHDHDEGEAHVHAFDLVYFRQRDAAFYGFEAAAEYDVAPIWNGLWGVSGQYDFVHARFDGGGDVPRIPPHRLGGGLYYRDANWLARVGVLHAFDQDRIGDDEEQTTPGYTLVSTELSYTVPAELGQPRVTIGVRGENLLDDEVLNHASFKRREGVLEPGASVRLFGSISLN